MTNVCVHTIGVKKITKTPVSARGSLVRRVDEIARRLDAVRVERGWSAREFSRLAGVSENQFTKLMERGGAGAGVEVVAGFAKVAEVPLDGLLGRTVGTGGDEPAWANLPGYRESERQLRTEAPHRYSEAVYMRGRRLRGIRPLELPVTVAGLRRLLTWIEENASLEELATLEEERLDKRLARDTKAADTRAKNAAAKKAAAEAKRPRLPEGKGKGR